MQQQFTPFNLSSKSQALCLQKAGLIILTCAFMLSHVVTTQAATTTGPTVKAKLKTHKNKSAAKSKASKNEQLNPNGTATLSKKENATPKIDNKSKVKAKPKPSEPLMLKEMVVSAGRAHNLLGLAGSASQGEVGQEQIEYRPISRPGELVELVPGIVSTQHSGSGKANQYFLRGYNLDHGTDFTNIVDGIPMNMVTNAHGQGYMDLNSLIPELVNKIDYGKGPYYAEIGDFSAAGYMKTSSMNNLPQGMVKFTGGEFGYYRTLVANSNKVGDGNLLYGAEFNYYDGAWVVPEDSHKYNGMLRYTLDKNNWGIAVSAKAYSNAWTSTNQIPQSAIDSNALNLYGSMNPTDGGSTNRDSLSTSLWNKGKDWKNGMNLYAVYYDLSLYSDFTGYLNGPQGDQVHQQEKGRIQLGGNDEFTHYDKLFGFDMDNTLGFNVRSDTINGLGLYETVNRQYLNTISLNNVQETTAGTFLKNQIHWHEKFSTIQALRVDTIHNQVTGLANGYTYGNAATQGSALTSGSAYAAPISAGAYQAQDSSLSSQINAANSGNSSKTMLSPKFSAIIGPWYDTEYYLNVGYGYHSNDARGTLVSMNPGNQFSSGSSHLASGTSLTTAADGSQMRPVTPMSWARGAEIGTRTSIIPKLNSTFTLWYLQSQSELVFSGDDGTTSVNGASDRMGLELTNYYKVNDWLTLDADLAKTEGHFVNTPTTPANGQCATAVGACTGNYIPNMVGTVIAAGVQVVAPNGYFGTLRLRHFGDSPLDSNGTYWAADVNILNLGLGYKQKNYKLDLSIFNLLDAQTSDIAYAYTTQYPASGSPTYGVVRHPVEPRMARAGFTIFF